MNVVQLSERSIEAMLIAGFVVFLLSELVTAPLKKKFETTTALSWVYRLIPILFCVVTAVVLKAIQGEISWELLKTAAWYEQTFFCASYIWGQSQLVYTIAWEKGIKKLVALIISKVTKRKAEDVEAALDKAGVGEVLDSVDEQFKDVHKDEEPTQEASKEISKETPKKKKKAEPETTQAAEGNLPQVTGVAIDETQRMRNI